MGRDARGSFRRATSEYFASPPWIPQPVEFITFHRRPRQRRRRASACDRSNDQPFLDDVPADLDSRRDVLAIGREADRRHITRGQCRERALVGGREIPYTPAGSCVAGAMRRSAIGRSCHARLWCRQVRNRTPCHSRTLRRRGTDRGPGPGTDPPTGCARQYAGGAAGGSLLRASFANPDWSANSRMIRPKTVAATPSASRAHANAGPEQRLGSDRPAGLGCLLGDSECTPAEPPCNRHWRPRVVWRAEDRPRRSTFGPIAKRWPSAPYRERVSGTSWCLRPRVWRRCARRA